MKFHLGFENPFPETLRFALACGIASRCHPDVVLIGKTGLVSENQGLAIDFVLQLFWNEASCPPIKQPREALLPVEYREIRHDVLALSPTPLQSTRFYGTNPVTSQPLAKPGALSFHHGGEAMPSDDADIVKRALQQIEPAPGEEAACRAQIEIACQHLARLRDYFANLENRPSPGELKTRLGHLTELVGEIIELITSVPADVRPMFLAGSGDPASRLTNLDRWHKCLNEVNAHYDEHHVPHGGRSLPPLKLLAAYYAYELLRRFSSKPRTLTPDGPYICLAQILYESATREEEADMRRACERVRSAW